MAIRSTRFHTASQATPPLASLALLCIFCVLPLEVVGKKRLRGGCTNDGMLPSDVPEVIESALIDYDKDVTAEDICSCVPSAAFDHFATQSKNAVMTMVKRTPEAMRHGLDEFGRATAELAEHAEKKCSKSKKAFGILKQLGWKLQPSNGPEEDFHYDAMKSLKVNGREIHDEINDFLLRFLSHSKSEKMGTALAELYEALIEKSEDEQGIENSQDAIDSGVGGQHIHA